LPPSVSESTGTLSESNKRDPGGARPPAAIIASVGHTPSGL
jgi:hypothetical protein